MRLKVHPHCGLVVSEQRCCVSDLRARAHHSLIHMLYPEAAASEHAKYVRRRGGQTLWHPKHPMGARLEMALGVARGMAAMEAARPPLIHRDLKPTNIFIGMRPPVPRRRHVHADTQLLYMPRPSPLASVPMGFMMFHGHQE